MISFLLSSRKKHIAFAFLCLISLEAAISGSHDEQKDDFDGRNFIQFRATKEERSNSGLDYIIYNYKPNNKTFQFMVGTEYAFVDCENLGLEIKTFDGTIHKISAVEYKLHYCIGTVKLDWVKKKFSVRVPMNSGVSRVGVMDTTSLKPERYIVK